MVYLITFLEGIITFISPCLLPMLPIYISYFSGQNSKGKMGIFLNALGFVLGFTTVFVTLGLLAGTVGSFFNKYSDILNIFLGLIMILLGLNITGLIKLPSFNKTNRFNLKNIKMNVFSSFIFGIVFSISYTPCVGTSLGLALMLAASDGEALKGTLMLLSYSIGLGIPLMISAVLIDSFKNSFNFIKKHYSIINIISGVFLIIFGILLATGHMGYFLGLLSRFNVINM